MKMSFMIGVLLTAALGVWAISERPTSACCPAPPWNFPVVNADQTVIIVWDAVRQTQHFIRTANFASKADDFGFIVPSPTEPELDESGGEAIPLLAQLTAPEVKRSPRPLSFGFGCSTGYLTSPGEGAWNGVEVLQSKEVAGLQATVLDAKSSGALLAWLKENGYAYSADIVAWAKPYIEQGWKFTALKVAKNRELPAAKSSEAIQAPSLRISFKTPTPLFPYREPNPQTSAEKLGRDGRTLRIYFLAEARYRGELTPENPWAARVAWSGPIPGEARRQLLTALKLPEETGPASFWLTEFVDRWPYRAAPSDLSFFRDPDQRIVRRPPIVEYASSGWPDVSLFALAAVMFAPPFLRRIRRQP